MSTEFLQVDLVSHSEILQQRMKIWMHTEEAGYFVENLRCQIKKLVSESAQSALQADQYPGHEAMSGKHLEEAKRLQIVLDTWTKWAEQKYEFQTLKTI